MTQTIFPSAGFVTRDQRLDLIGQHGSLFWFTGLSGAGKTTVTLHVERELVALGRFCYRLDGDNIRNGLCRDLGFSPADRAENLRRVAEAAKLFLDAGLVCLASFISPLESDRHLVREIVGAEHYHEIFVKCPLTVCESRDPKGLYRLARQGIIKEFTGISAPFEEPGDPHLLIETDQEPVERCVRKVLDFILPVINP